MATAKLNRIDPAVEFDQNVTGYHYVDVAYVVDLDTSAPEAVLTNALGAAGIGTIGDGRNGDAYCTMIRRHIGAVDANNVVKVTMTYETPGYKGLSGSTGENTLLLDSIGLSTDSKEVACQFTPAGGSTPLKRTGKMQWFVPLRTLRIIGQVVPSNIDAISAAVGHVNSSSYKGLGVGYWLLFGLNTSTSHIAGQGGYEATIISRQTRNWLSYDAWRDMHGDIPPSVMSNINAVRATAYQYGPIASPPNGWYIEGLYPTVDFNSLFGTTSRLFSFGTPTGFP